MKRFCYRAVIAGLKVLDEIEHNEKPFTNYNFNVSSDNESDDDDEKNSNCKNYLYGRQDNVMSNGHLSEAFEDINCELIKRVDSTASNYQRSPKTTHRLQSSLESQLSFDDLKEYSILTPTATPYDFILVLILKKSFSSYRHDVETSFRLRQERSIRNGAIEKQINEIKTKLHQQSSSILTTNNQTSLYKILTTKYRCPLFICLLTLLTGSLLIYNYASSNNRKH